MKNALGAVDSVLLLGGRSEIGLAICRRLVAGGARQVVLAVRDEPHRDEPGLDEPGLDEPGLDEPGRDEPPGRTQPAGGGPDAAAAAASQSDVTGAVAPSDTARAALREAGAEVSVVAFDVEAPQTHATAIGAVFDRLGDVDVVIDAVGVLGTTAAYEADPVGAARSAVVNFAGHVCADLVVADRLRAQGHGTLVVLSSAAGVRVRKANYVYGAAKAGLDGFALGLGDALEGSGARVLVVRPGFVRTQMTAGLRAAPFAVSADRVARAVVDGLRLDREVVWVPGLLGPAFAVARLLPRALWRRLPL